MRTPCSLPQQTCPPKLNSQSYSSTIVPCRRCPPSYPVPCQILRRTSFQYHDFCRLQVAIKFTTTVNASFTWCYVCNPSGGWKVDPVTSSTPPRCSLALLFSSLHFSPLPCSSLFLPIPDLYLLPLLARTPTLCQENSNRCSVSYKFDRDESTMEDRRASYT